MRAPVCRNVEARNSIAGVSMTGFVVLLACAYPLIALLPPAPAILAMAGAYVSVRVAGHGRPPLFWQHFIVWQVRRRIADGRLSAAARARTPEFPFAYHLSRVA